MVKRVSAGIRLRKDGKYEARFTVSGKRYSVYGNTVKECKEKEVELRVKIKNGTYIDNRNITFGQYYQEWKAAREGAVKESTAYSIESQYRVNFGPAFGKRKLVDIEKREIVRFQQELSENYKASTVNLIFVNLKSILNSAVVDGILERSPAAGIKPMKESGEQASKTSHRALTEEEQGQFMKYAREEWLYELFSFLLCTGMRIGEAAALTWNDIDHVKNVIHVTKTVSKSKDGHGMVGSPKSRAGIRDIPINDSIKLILKSQKEKQSLYYGNVISLSQYVFIGQNRTRVHNSSANEAVKRVLKKMRDDGAEIEDFTVHAFRDTFATRYIEQGGSPQVLKTILGHSSLSMTMDLYSHVMPNTRQEEMDSIKIAF